jgi:hydroxymethylpyrimidine pyrophosphatase-like HAD family hydrolase
MNVLAFDLDGTLIDKNGDALPLVKEVNQLFENPENFIVIHTARSYSLFHQTRKQLLFAGISYHALVCEKMRATKYIDDKAVKP